MHPDEEVHSSSRLAGEGLRQLDALLDAARSLIAAYAGEAAPGPPRAPAQPSAASLDPSALASARERYMAASSGLRVTLQLMEARQQEERNGRPRDAGAKLLCSAEPAACLMLMFNSVLQICGVLMFNDDTSAVAYLFYQWQRWHSCCTQYHKSMLPR